MVSISTGDISFFRQPQTAQALVRDFPTRVGCGLTSDTLLTWSLYDWMLRLVIHYSRDHFMTGCSSNKGCAAGLLLFFLNLLKNIYIICLCLCASVFEWVFLFCDIFVGVVCMFVLMGVGGGVVGLFVDFWFCGFVWLLLFFFFFFFVFFFFLWGC